MIKGIQKDGDWNYVTTKTFTFNLVSRDIKDGQYLCYSKDKLIGAIQSYSGVVIITVLSGYAFDGASLAPDFDSVMVGVIAHDFCYQFLNTPNFPINRSQADGLLRDYSTNGFLGNIYWGAVRVFGGIYRFFGREIMDKNQDLRVDLIQ